MVPEVLALYAQQASDVAGVLPGDGLDPLANAYGVLQGGDQVGVGRGDDGDGVGVVARSDGDVEGQHDVDALLAACPVFRPVGVLGPVISQGAATQLNRGRLLPAGDLAVEEPDGFVPASAGVGLAPVYADPGQHPGWIAVPPEVAEQPRYLMESGICGKVICVETRPARAARGPFRRPGIVSPFKRGRRSDATVLESEDAEVAISIVRMPAHFDVDSVKGVVLCVEASPDEATALTPADGIDEATREIFGRFSDEYEELCDRLFAGDPVFGVDAAEDPSSR